MTPRSVSPPYAPFRGAAPRRRGVLQWLFGWFSGLLRFVLATVLFFALMTVFVYWLVCRVFLPPGDLRTPDLLGKPFLEAAKQLRSQNLAIKWERDQPSEAVEEGSIISQSPEPNTPVKKGSSVKVIVSGGVALVPLPDLRRVPQNRAQHLLHKAGLEVGNRTLLPSPADPVGTVLETDPPASTGVAQGSRVNLLVATGQTQVTQAMPNLTGMKLDQAREVLTQAGLFATEVQAKANGAPPDQVVGQSPAPGESVSDSTHIVLKYTAAAVEPDEGPAAPAPAAAETQNAETSDTAGDVMPPIDDGAIPAVTLSPSEATDTAGPIEIKPSDLEGSPAPQP